MLGLQRIQVSQRLRRVRRRCVQAHHGREEWRLAATEIVRAVAIGDVTDGADQVREVIEHAANEVDASALDESEHREIGIPVVHLAESAAGHHERVREGNQGRSPGLTVGVPRQHRPERTDVLFHRPGRIRPEIVADGGRQREVALHERGETETRRVLCGPVGGHYRRGRTERLRVHEGLRVGEQR